MKGTAFLRFALVLLAATAFVFYFRNDNERKAAIDNRSTIENSSNEVISTSNDFISFESTSRYFIISRIK